jgi:hypothetical protein
MSTEHWEKLYSAAALETDWSRIEELIEVAENAIRARLSQLSVKGGTPEHEAMTSAMDRLKLLRNDVATWKLKHG